MCTVRSLVAEFLGTALLLGAVVGSGILAHRLDMGNVALAVLCVSFATGAVLSATIFAFGHISAHFNPAVTLVSALRRELAWSKVLPYIVAQLAGAVVGVLLSNLMFELPALSISETVRSGPGQWLGEFIATFALIGIILGCARSNPAAIPIAVPFYVSGAIFFTSSTCFANPAVTIARIFTNSLTGIEPHSVLPYIVFQIAGALAATAVFGWLFSNEKKSEPEKTVNRSELENIALFSQDKEKFSERELAGSSRK